MCWLSFNCFFLDEGYSSIGGFMGGFGGGGGGYVTIGSIGVIVGSGGDVVDECGLRFLFVMRYYICLMRLFLFKYRVVFEEKVSEIGFLLRYILFFL